MRKFSRAILIVHFAIMGFVSLVAVLFCVAMFFMHAQKPSDLTRIFNSIISALSIYAIFSGYEFSKWVFHEGPRFGRKLNIFTLVGVIIGVSITVIGWAYMLSNKYINYESLLIYAAPYGALYVPILVHFLAEIYFQKRANKSSHSAS